DDRPVYWRCRSDLRRVAEGELAEVQRARLHRGTGCPSLRYNATLAVGPSRAMTMKLALLAILAGIFSVLLFINVTCAAECISCGAKCRECGFLNNGCIGRCRARGDPLVRANQSCHVPRFSRCRLR